MKEIVGARIGNIITNNFQAIRDAAKAGIDMQFYDRLHMQFMSSCDLGINWDRMANGPTLFLIDKNGKPHKSDPA